MDYHFYIYHYYIYPVMSFYPLQYISIFLLIQCISFLLCAFQTIEKLLSLLGTLDRWIDETPPVDQPSRFGNKAYRTWYAKLEQVQAMLCV